ncbi:MAG: DUF6498-containing protein [Burkholderiales bacterium]
MGLTDFLKRKPRLRAEAIAAHYGLSFERSDNPVVSGSIQPDWWIGTIDGTQITLRDAGGVLEVVVGEMAPAVDYVLGRFDVRRPAPGGSLLKETRIRAKHPVLGRWCYVVAAHAGVALDLLENRDALDALAAFSQNVDEVAIYRRGVELRYPLAAPEGALHRDIALALRIQAQMDSRQRRETHAGDAAGDPQPTVKATSPRAPAPVPDPVTLTSPSTLALFAANVVPMVGVLFFGWNIGDVLLLYWGESAVIGFYTLLKLGVVVRKSILLLGPFFILHFGFIMLWFLGVTLMIAEEAARIDAGRSTRLDFAAIAWGLAPALVAFLVSHGVSFHANFLGRREYVGREARDLMFEPYRRVGPMLLMVLLAAFFVTMFGGVRVLMLVVIALKLAFDVSAHLAERRRAAEASRSSSAPAP